MRALIERDGTFVILPERDTEEYALMKWYQQACDGEVKLVIEMEQGQNTGALTLGPQIMKLEVMTKTAMPKADDGN